MLRKQAVVDEARTWLNTPFAHQARRKGVGCDCGGLVGGVAVACGLVSEDWWSREFDPLFSGYGRLPLGQRLHEICSRFMREIPLGAAMPGDVLLLSFSEDPQHLAIAADYRHGGLSMIHALSSLGRVTEHRLAPPWKDRLVAAFELPGVE